MQTVLKQIWKRTRPGLLVFGVFFIGSLTQAWGALQFDVFLGYDGTVREASWFPIVCEIKNDGPSFAGVIEVTAAGYSKGSRQRLPVELPTGTLKRVVIPAFAASRYPTLWDVRLLDERGKVREEQVALRPQRQLGWEIKLIGSLSRTASGAATLLPIKRNQPDAQPVAARFQPSIFPDNPLVLEALDAIYLNSEVAANLRAGQVNALLGWVNAGGHLIVALEQVSDVTASPWLRKLLPIEPKDMVGVAKHPELEDWLRAGEQVAVTQPGDTRRGQGNRNRPGPQSPDPSSPAPFARSPFADLPVDAAFEAAEIRVVAGEVRDGHVVLSAGDVPLKITANRGSGRVTALTFSPEREPFKSWKNLTTFWTRLAEVPAALYASTDYAGGYGQSADGIFGAMIDSRQVHKLPVGWLLALLLVYLLVIGPLDRWWLKRINKPMLTWITFPAYVIFFSGLIYFIGYKLRAGESECTELHVVDALRNGERAELRGRTFLSIYSPANAKYPLASDLKFATFRGEFMPMSGGQNAEGASILHTGDNFRAEVFVPVWTSQLYVSDWWHSGTMPLTLTLQAAGDDWLLTVQNLTEHAVTASQLVVGGSMFPVGPLAAGQSKTMKLAKASGMSLPEYVRANAASYMSEVQQRQRAFGSGSSGQIHDLTNACMAASFLGQLGPQPGGQNFIAPPGLDLSAVVAHGNAVLLAWSPGASPVPPVNQVKTKRTAANTLWRVPVEIKN